VKHFDSHISTTDGIVLVKVHLRRMRWRMAPYDTAVQCDVDSWSHYCEC